MIRGVVGAPAAVECLRDGLGGHKPLARALVRLRPNALQPVLCHHPSTVAGTPAAVRPRTDLLRRPRAGRPEVRSLRALRLVGHRRTGYLQYGELAEDDCAYAGRVGHTQRAVQRHARRTTERQQVEEAVRPASMDIRGDQDVTGVFCMKVEESTLWRR